MRFFPGIITRNWQLKLSALAMAVLLWTVPEFETQSSQVLENVPVRVQLTDPEWALLREPLPASVQVTVSGSTRALLALRAARPAIVVPVNQVSSADTAILLLQAWLQTSVGEQVTVEDLVPSSVRLSFEPIEVEAATLLYRFTGALPPGLSLARPPEVNPGFVRVSGPASRLDGLTTLSLMPLDLSEIRSSGTFVLPVDTSGIAGMALSPQRASVEIVLEETVARRFPDLPVRLPVLDLEPQLQARPSTVSVVLSGARSLIDAVDPAGLRVTVSRTVATALVPGEEVRATLSVEGVPDMIQAALDPEWVLLRRPTGQ
ncbi:MAG: CdaR family protein [Longimicrobiales bacterium]